MNIKQILDAKNWFFVATVQNGTEEQLIVFYLAAWALLESGKVVGLISVSDSAAFEGDKTPRLVSVPPFGEWHLQAQRRIIGCGTRRIEKGWRNNSPKNGACCHFNSSNWG